MKPNKKPTKKSKEFILLNKAGVLLAELYQFIGAITFRHDEYEDQGTCYMDAVVDLASELGPYYDEKLCDKHDKELDKYFNKLSKSKKNKLSKKK
jgi:hypothetical protein